MAWHAQALGVELMRLATLTSSACALRSALSFVLGNVKVFLARAATKIIASAKLATIVDTTDANPRRKRLGFLQNAAGGRFFQRL